MATPHTTKGTPESGRPLPVDDHGRRLSTTPAAAAHYRLAQRAVPATELVSRALRDSLAVDPDFAIADAALSALDGREHRRSARPTTAWERRHLDIVTAVQSAQPERAVDLLREHLLDVGCDPVATVVVQVHMDAVETADLLAQTPDCHPWTTKE